MSRSTAHNGGTVSIEGTDAAVALELNGRDTVTVHITEDANATYQVDGRKVGGSWLENFKEFTGGGPHKSTFDFACEEVRVRVSAGTSGATDEATINIFGAG